MAPNGLGKLTGKKNPQIKLKAYKNYEYEYLCNWYIK